MMISYTHLVTIEIVHTKSCAVGGQAQVKNLSIFKRFDTACQNSGEIWLM